MSRRVRECKRGCGYPALPGRQFCNWHALLRKSSTEQAEAAQRRREYALVDLNLPEVPRVRKESWPSGERWCAGCQSFVPLFYVSGSRCKACASAAAHAGRVEKVYGITAEEYDAILKRQDGRCAICRNQSRTIRLAVDHDHVTGEVRGLLCKRCNHDLLGGGHDSPELMARALLYLLVPPARVDTPEPEDVWALIEPVLLAEYERRWLPEPEPICPAYEPPPF